MSSRVRPAARRPFVADTMAAAERLEDRRLLTTVSLDAAGGTDQSVTLDAGVTRVVLTDDAGGGYGAVSIDASGVDASAGGGVEVRFADGVEFAGFRFTGSAGADRLGRFAVADGGRVSLDFIEGADDVIAGFAGAAEHDVYSLSGLTVDLGGRRGTVNLGEFDDYQIADTLTLAGGPGRQVYTGAYAGSGRLAIGLSWHDLVEDVSARRDLTLNYGDGQNRAFVEGAAVGGSLFVNLGERSNFVRLNDVTAARVVVAGAGGADRLTSENLTAGGVALDLGGGFGAAAFRGLNVAGHVAFAAADSARLTVTGAVGGNVKYEGTGVWNSLRVRDAEVGGRVVARTAGGRDAVTVWRSTVGRVNLALGGGRDAVTFRDATLVGGGRVNLGRGRDAFVADKTAAGGRLTVAGGGGRDDVAVTRGRFDRLTVRGGTGDDRVALDRTDVADRLFADLGAGDDALDLARSGGVAALKLGRARGQDLLDGLDDFAGDLRGDLRGLAGDLRDRLGDRVGEGLGDLADDARDAVDRLFG